jgi:hypothetical protein
LRIDEAKSVQLVLKKLAQTVELSALLQFVVKCFVCVRLARLEWLCALRGVLSRL